jgi:hypothetical protein
MKTFSHSFRDVWGHKLEWFRVAFAPLVLWGLGALVISLVFGHTLELHQVLMGQITGGPMTNGDIANGEIVNIEVVDGAKTSLILAQTLYFIIYLIATLSLYINGFRYGVLHEGRNRWWTLHLNWRFVKLFLYMILLQILMGAYAAIAAGAVYGIHLLLENIGVDVILGLILGLYGIYILLRVSLYPLLISIDKVHPLRTSWALLKGNVLRLVGLFLLVGLALLGVALGGFIVLLIVGILLALISPVLASASAILMILFGALMIFLLWAVMTKALSLAYQGLVEKKKTSKK